MMITLERVKELLDYDPATGVFRWRVDRGRLAKAGDVAGTLHPKGYQIIHTGKKFYKAHRLAWFFVHGVWPAEEIDHVRGEKADNRIGELREATHAQNTRNRKAGRNSKSGIKGVTWHKGRCKWRASIGVGGKAHHIGLYSSVLAAEIAYGQAAAIFHRQFASF